MGRGTFPLGITQKPEQGPVGMPFTNFPAVVAGTEIDLALEQMDGSFDFPQALWVNNQSGQTITFDFLGAGYSISVKDKQIGMYPVIVPNGITRFRVTAVGAPGTVNFILFNVPQDYFVYSVA